MGSKRLLIKQWKRRSWTVFLFPINLQYIIMGKQSHRKKLGKTLGVPDGQIIAIALADGAAVATKNIRDFMNCGLNLVNPFEEIYE